MGAEGSKSSLSQVTKRAEERAGKVQVSGRYNRLPKRVEDYYHVEKKVLGTGYNGSVFMARSKSTDSKFAVKSFRLVGVNKEKRLELETEAEIFLSMDHPHVARLVDVYEDEVSLHLVMECMEGGELFDRVRQRKAFSEKDAAHASYQMLLAVNYLHSQSIVHRDLKLENFLYEKMDTDHLKLIDFGFSHIWEPNTKMASSCGTLAYVAPEVLNKSYTSKCDMWSLGVIIFILLVGYMPFSGPGEHAQVANIRAGRYNFKPEKWHRVSKMALDFVKKLLVVDAAVRLSAEQALEHPWLQLKNHKDQEAEEDINEETVEALCNFGKNTQFRRACMSVMAWSLSNEERAKVRQEFIKLDKTRSGTITLSELKRVLTTKFKVQDEEIQTVFESLDTSNDEEIHYTEFLAAMVSTRITMHDELLTATFRRFDVDNSGYITRENLKTVLGDQFSGAQVEVMLQEADLKKDGKISYDEFFAYLKGGELGDMYTDAAEALIEAEKKNADGPRGLEFQAFVDKFGLSKRTTGSLSSKERPRGEDSVARRGTGGTSMLLAPAEEEPSKEASATSEVAVKSRTCAIL